MFDFMHLYNSYEKASKGHGRSLQVIRFWFYLERELDLIDKDIKLKTYKPRKKKPFIIFEPKQRKIFESHFRDRVVHHALCSILNPVFEKHSLPMSYACRKGYGNLRALNNLRARINSLTEANEEVWLLKIDIRKYFDSIPHDKLINLIKRHTDNSDLLWLSRKIITSHENSPQKGLPIGNLTSQIFANLYLNELDHFIVHKKRFKYLFRFMDDLVIVHPRKETLELLLEEIKIFCSNALELEVHPNKIVLSPAKKGIEFLGFHVTNTKRTIKPTNMARIKIRLRNFSKMLARDQITTGKIEQSLKSWMGYACHGQVRFQLKHLVTWSAFDPQLQKLCQNVFFRPSKGRPPGPKPKRLALQNAHIVLYQSPLDREICESECEFFRALQLPQQALAHDDLQKQWPQSDLLTP